LQKITRNIYNNMSVGKWIIIHLLLCNMFETAHLRIEGNNTLYNVPYRGNNFRIMYMSNIYILSVIYYYIVFYL